MAAHEQREDGQRCLRWAGAEGCSARPGLSQQRRRAPAPGQVQRCPCTQLTWCPSTSLLAFLALIWSGSSTVASATARPSRCAGSACQRRPSGKASRSTVPGGGPSPRDSSSHAVTFTLPLMLPACSASAWNTATTAGSFSTSGGHQAPGGGGAPGGRGSCNRMCWSCGVTLPGFAASKSVAAQQERRRRARKAPSWARNTWAWRVSIWPSTNRCVCYCTNSDRSKGAACGTSFATHPPPVAVCKPPCLLSWLERLTWTCSSAR
jgi:hypothetical protein